MFLLSKKVWRFFLVFQSFNGKEKRVAWNCSCITIRYFPNYSIAGFFFNPGACSHLIIPFPYPWTVLSLCKKAFWLEKSWAITLIDAFLLYFIEQEMTFYVKVRSEMLWLLLICESKTLLLWHTCRVIALLFILLSCLNYFNTELHILLKLPL